MISASKLVVPDKIFVDFQVATMAAAGQVLSRDVEKSELLVAQDTPYGVISGIAIGVARGKIAWLLPEAEVPEFEGNPEIIRGGNRLLTPGLIDCHTHLVYGGNRAEEWEMRLTGRPYEEIAKAGGGILSSVRMTRAASESRLVADAQKRLARFQAEGVTTVEIKSGYGLDVESEIKMLRVARRLEEVSQIRVEATLLGAHAVPPEFQGRADDYVDLVCNKMIPAAIGHCVAVDAFCESIAFDVVQTRRVLEAALDAGLKIKVHAEQLTHMGMAVEAARLGALSVDHLEYLTEEDCVSLAETETVATLLPGAFYCLRETKKPPVQKLFDAGVPVAIASDSNPGSSPVASLLLVGHLACTLFGLTPEQALHGMTRHAAKALGLQGQIGELIPGANADFAIWDVLTPAEILYQPGANPCVAVYQNGERRVQNDE